MESLKVAELILKIIFLLELDNFFPKALLFFFYIKFLQT